MNNQDRVKLKIVQTEALGRELSRLRFKDKKIVFTNGCFDILHRGHIEYLMVAANMGDILVIGLNSDASVKRLKGIDRPVQDEQSRALLLASLQFITYVCLFEEDTPYNLINLVQPDILAKGGDYTNIKEIVGYDIVNKKGGQVLTIPFVEGFSTTSILKKVVSL